jgi:hypothetical protein
MSKQTKKTPYLTFIVVMCLILAGCSGGSGGGAEAALPVDSVGPSGTAATNSAAPSGTAPSGTAATNSAAPSGTAATNTKNMKKMADSMNMSVEEMVAMGESMGMSMEDMMNMGDSMGSNQYMESNQRMAHTQAPQETLWDSNLPNILPTGYASIDPSNPPKIATHNFIDLDPYIRITKIRAVYGHNYNYGSPEYDPTGASCSSMKHYFDAYTSDQRWDGSFGSYDTRGVVKFYSPVDGNMNSVIPNEIEQGTEYQFYISPTDYQRLTFTFHHVDLLEEFVSGGSVTAGQHIGYIMRPHGQGEIAVTISVGSNSEYISFFDVMTDEVFAEYQARGITSRDQMTISKEERAANPIPCTLGDGQGGKFYSASGDQEAFNGWQDGPDNWVELE